MTAIDRSVPRPGSASALLLDGTSRDPGVLGGKGASLDCLISWELPVPPSGAVTTSAYRELVKGVRLEDIATSLRQGAELSADDIDTMFADARFDNQTADSIVDVARRVADGRRLAVRSSATVEDLADSSFAGQYRSMLDIDPADTDGLLQAVRLVFASLWHPAPRAYRAAFGIDDADAAMAVVLMQMVPARQAGVVFTVDPGGVEGGARVEAVEGLGEALVSGQRTPEAWVLDRRSSVTDADTPPAVQQALALALEVEARTAAPQDVEWATDGETTWIIQARPITTIDDSDAGDGFDDELDDEDLTTMGIGEMLPGVLPPLLWELNSHLVEEAFRRVLDDLGISSADANRPRHLVRRVRGRAALDFGRLESMARALPGASSTQLEEQYFGSRRPERAAPPPAESVSRRHHLLHDIRVLAATRRNSFEAEAVIEAVHEIAGNEPDLGDLSDDQVLAFRLGLVDLGVRAMSAELGVAAAAAAAYRRVELMLLPHLGVEEAGRQTERVTAALGLSAPSPEASAAVFAGPAWHELGLDPSVGRRVLGDDAAQHALDELMDQLDESPTWQSSGVRGVLRARALRHSVHEAMLLLGRRERTKAALLRLGGIVRKVHQELGRRLVGRALLETGDDIELLTTNELHAAMAGQAPPEVTVARRRRWRMRYESEPPLPVRFQGEPEVVEVALPPGGRLEGWAASRGRFAGTARVLRTPKDHLEVGEILVTEATDASWSPLFVRAGAIVLERGGPLSHAAILARELGVPAVLNVAGATGHLDGRHLTVDGDAGVVVVHDNGGARS